MQFKLNDFLGRQTGDIYSLLKILRVVESTEKQTFEYFRDVVEIRDESVARWRIFVQKWLSKERYNSS